MPGSIDEENTPKPAIDSLLPKIWPTEGHIQFKCLSLRYVENDPPVLNDVNFVIQPGEKIGIVGRTGAGKSSLITALFRLAPIEGSIFIDGVDTKTIGLIELRKNISIIPQEPVLFSESLRYNLDPFGEFEDDELWKALDEVELREAVSSLDFMFGEGGNNFSLGQKQLICLARAILRNNKILVLDEATANVDERTDSFIQATIRKKFKDCTVLTIAHRLNTIMDSDKVIVMSFGHVLEFDHPHNLLQIPHGHFHKMLLETGPSVTSRLKQIAEEAYANKQVDS
nr:probable multidrug resistance-associated protein lethal(2)03659 [Leptinotarsa decemlineata]